MKLFFRQYGQPQHPPIIILHGLFGISDNWVSHGKRLAEEGFYVIIPDLRNHGRSPHNKLMNYAAMTEDLHELMEEIHIDRVSLLGHSMGGKIAMKFSLENPEMVEKVVVVDISPRKYHPHKNHSKIIQAVKKVNLNHLFSRKAVEQKLSEMIPEHRIVLFIMKNLHRTKEGKFEWLFNIQAIEEHFDALFESIESPSQYHGPSLFIKGEKSDYILPDDRTIILQHFPHATIKTIEGTSHWVQAEAPDKFFRIANEFLKTNPPKSTLRH